MEKLLDWSSPKVKQTWVGILGSGGGGGVLLNLKLGIDCEID